MVNKAGNIAESMPTQATQPSANAETIKTDNLESSFGKNSKFLTNDSGQTMSQALLLMALVAANWSDSDEEDEEITFKEKLHKALQKQIQQSQPPGEA